VKYIHESNDMIFLWNNYYQQLKGYYTQSTSIQSVSGSWSVAFGAAFSYVSYLRGASTSPLMSTWHELLLLSMNQLNKDLQYFETKEFIDQLVSADSEDDKLIKQPLKLTSKVEVEESVVTTNDEPDNEGKNESEEVLPIMTKSEKKSNNSSIHKQAISKCLESLQVFCFILNQEEFKVIRYIKGSKDPLIETIFRFMKQSMINITSSLRRARSLIQEKNSSETWILDNYDRTIKMTKSVQSLLEGNSSNKTD
jgi:hypothetical protein